MCFLLMSHFQATRLWFVLASVCLSVWMFIGLLTSEMFRQGVFKSDSDWYVWNIDFIFGWGNKIKQWEKVHLLHLASSGHWFYGNLIPVQVLPGDIILQTSRLLKLTVGRKKQLSYKVTFNLVIRRFVMSINRFIMIRARRQ